MTGAEGAGAEDPSPEDTAPEDTASDGRPGGRRWLRRAFVLAVVVALAVVLWEQRDVVATSLRALTPASLVLSLLFAMVSAGLPGLAWRHLLVRQGYEVPPLAGLRVFFVAQLGKYLPGGIWNLVAQVAMARDVGIPGRQGATATLLVLALSVLTSLLVAGVTLPFAVPDLVAQYWWTFAILPVLVFLLLPRSVAWWSEKAFRLMRRPGRPIVLSGSDLLRVALLLSLAWVALGLHFGFLVRDLGGEGAQVWLLSTGVFALAWVAGLLVVIAPAGAGIREAVLVLGFATTLGVGPVLTAAVVSRLLLVLADVVLAGVLVAAARIPRRGRAPGADPAP